jgi:microcystin-dependent protein
MQLTNNAISLLAQPIDTTITTIKITSGDESRFPVAAVATDQWFPVTITDNVGNREIMRCTSRTGVTLTVVRGQEGTAKRGFPLNSRVEVRLTAGALLEATSDAGSLTKGIVPDPRLPPRLRATEMSLGTDGDANLVTESGTYWLPTGVTNTPVDYYAWLKCDVASAAVQLQEWQRYNSDERWRRQKVNSVWGAWTRVWNVAPEDIPIGTVFDFAGPDTKLPSGWLLCDGRALTYGAAGSTYYALYAVIGRTYTEAALPATQYRLPDLRGRVVAGKDNMGAGGSANRLTNPTASTVGGINGDTLGAVGGFETHTLLDSQISAHVHNLATATARTKTGEGDHTHNYSTLTGAQAPGYEWGNGNKLNTLAVSGAGEHVHSLVGDTASVGSDKPHNNVQPTIILNKMIRYI